MSCISFFGSALVYVTLALATIFGCAAWPDEGAVPTKNKARGLVEKDNKPMVAMIDALANRNQPPKLVDIEDALGPQLPVFPMGYDWKEQQRVLVARFALSKEKSPEMWEELVRHVDDQRYCLTLMDGSESYADGNMSVGWFCKTLAAEWLLGVCNQHLPRKPLIDTPIFLPVGPNENWNDWRKQRKDKRLYELQIEVCEETIRLLAKTDGVTQREKNQSREKIEAEIATLKKTKRPVFTDYTTTPIFTYSSKSAKEAREELRRKGRLPIEKP